MSDKPLEPPRRDPTANQAIARVDALFAEPRPSRVSYRYASPASVYEYKPPTEPEQTLDEVRARRQSLLSVLAGLCADLETCLPHERKMLGMRKSSIEASLSYLRRKETMLVASLPPKERVPPSPVQAATEQRLQEIGPIGALHYLLRMFHFYTKDDDGMPAHHRAFMGQVGRIVKDAGYGVGSKGVIDPLDGLTDTTEAA